MYSLQNHHESQEPGFPTMRKEFFPSICCYFPTKTAPKLKFNKSNYNDDVIMVTQQQKTTTTLVESKTENIIVSEPATMIHELRDADIICGKDRLAHANPGNHCYRKMVHFYREEYQRASKREDKTKITNKIIQTVHEAGGRFLRFQDNAWVTVDAAGIHDKVSHSLRSARNPKYTEAKKNQCQQQQQQRGGENFQLQQLPFNKQEEDRFVSLVAAQQEFFDLLVQQQQHGNSAVFSNSKQSEAFLFEFLLQQQRQTETIRNPALAATNHPPLLLSSQSSSSGSSSTITTEFGSLCQRRCFLSKPPLPYSQWSSSSGSSNNTTTEKEDDMAYSDDDTPTPVLFWNQC